MDKYVQIFGKKIAARREALNLGQDQLGALIGKTGRRISGIETSEVARVFRTQVLKLCKALQLDQETFTKEYVVPAANKKSTFHWKKAEFPIVSGEVMPAIYELDVAASGWSEPSGIGISDNPRSEWFIIRVRGDSMTPRWLDGDLVMFHRLNAEEHSPVPGVDYLFMRNDGCSTLKRLDHVDDETLVLKALNKKYKKPLTISKQELVMVAEARWKVVDAPQI